MKKILGLLLIGTFLFTGCEKAKENDKDVVTSQEKIQELGKTINDIDTNVNNSIEFGFALDENGKLTDFENTISTEITLSGDFYLHYEGKKVKLEIPNNEKVVMAVENGSCSMMDSGEPIILTDKGNVYQVEYSQNRLSISDFNRKTPVQLPLVKLNSVNILAFTKRKDSGDDCSPGIASMYGEDKVIYPIVLK